MPRCSIIIRCFNEEKHIGRLLSGILEQTESDVEIVLVDSGSIDATLAIASRYPVKVLSIKPEDFSFGRSLNVGCAGATGDFLVIVSAHVYPVYNDWLENMLKPFNDPDVALVYGKQRGDKTARYSEHQIYKQWFPNGSEVHQKHPFCNNANAVVRRSLWKEIPYDEELTGLEDLAWAKSVTVLGKKIVYSAEAEIIHVHEESYMQILNRYTREALAFKRIYPDESFGVWDFMKLFSANVMTDYYHSSLDGRLFANLFSIPAFRLMQFWGTLRGYSESGLVTTQLRRRFYYPDIFGRNKSDFSDEKDKKRIRYEDN
jgi:glycosyltransferase involved in cell wall biosynthesis